MEIATAFTFILDAFLFSIMSTNTTFTTSIHNQIISLTEYKENCIFFSDILLK